LGTIFDPHKAHSQWFMAFFRHPSHGFSVQQLRTKVKSCVQIVLHMLRTGVPEPGELSHRLHSSFYLRARTDFRSGSEISPVSL